MQDIQDKSYVWPACIVHRVGVDVPHHTLLLHHLPQQLPHHISLLTSNKISDSRFSDYIQLAQIISQSNIFSAKYFLHQISCPPNISSTLPKLTARARAVCPLSGRPRSRPSEAMCRTCMSLSSGEYHHHDNDQNRKNTKPSSDEKQMKIIEIAKTPSPCLWSLVKQPAAERRVVRADVLRLYRSPEQTLITLWWLFWRSLWWLLLWRSWRSR